MTPNSLKLNVGQTAKVTARQTGTDVVSTLPTYTTSNSSVATVDSSGNVTGISIGTATIRGLFGKYVAGETIVIVSGPSGWSGEMTPTKLTIKVGGTGKVQAKQTGELLVKTLPEYHSSDIGIATVDSDGTVHGIKKGTVTIIGRFGDYIAGVTTVTVTPYAIWSGEMTPMTLSLMVGETGKVQAEQTGSVRVLDQVTYTSSDTSVVTVDNNGNVTAVKKGTATITGRFGNNLAGTTTVTVSEPTWTGKMTPVTLSLTVGDIGKVQAEQTGTFRVKTLPTYTSSNSSVATVDSNGNVTALKAGTTIITGKYGEYVAGTTTVTVSETTWTGKMTPTTLSLTVGDIGKVKAEQTGRLMVGFAASYTSSDPSVATVDSNGNVTALKAGTTIITGKFGKYTAGTTTVTVSEATWTGKMTPTNLSLMVGETGKVTAQQTGRLMVGFAASYTSSDPSVATVDSNGNVHALKAGTTIITGKFGKYTAGTTTVTVNEAMWTGEMTPTNISLAVGETGKVEAKQTGTLLVKTLPTYSSSDPSIVTVDNNGNLKAIKKGKATITGRFGNYIAGTTTVTVTNSSSWAGRMTPSTLSLAVGETGKVTAEQISDIQMDTLPTYTSSDPSVASVDSKGNVKALSVGTAIITGKFGNSVAGTTLITVYDDWSGEMIPTTLSLVIGDTGKVYAKQTGAVLIKTLPTYTSSDPSVATVDNDGNVKALKAGKAIITGQFGNNVAGTTEVTVLELEIINNWTGKTEVKKGTDTISVGGTTTVNVHQTGDIIVDSDVTYSSSNPLVATVDENGIVTGLKPGTVVITAKVGNNLKASNVTITVFGENAISNKKTMTKFYVIAAIFVVACVAVILVKLTSKKYE